MTPKSEFGSRVKFFFWKFSLEMIEFILIRNPNEILRVKLSKLGFHFQNFIPYKKRPWDLIVRLKLFKNPRRQSTVRRETTGHQQDHVRPHRYQVERCAGPVEVQRASEW